MNSIVLQIDKKVCVIDIHLSLYTLSSDSAAAQKDLAADFQIKELQLYLQWLTSTPPLVTMTVRFQNHLE